ncbi:mitochondrial protein [Guyanagaster necrorhizus]|uniref:Mitochondrial protein n=1 Tax=Guyanagaster necrorhizus TaxID=856835 RepID=A0A9P7VUR1_9AGAR|nr:mitochondrial protein [Guyanagaster necrorhizus MCA 3950]KAG7447227.1 mitochondrial protein [Guyanagaster necrorhizus MCA 3950]
MTPGPTADTDNDPDDAKKLQKWQEERIARRLRGEYESAALYLSELIHNNLSTPLNIHSVRVEGAKNTRGSFLGFLIDPVLLSEPHNDLQSVLYAARSIADVLLRTETFSSVETRIEHARDELAGPRDVNLVFKTRERGRWFVKSATEFGNNEGSASITARILNVFGGAESFEANISAGTTTRKSFQGTLSVPTTSDLNCRADFTVFGLHRDQTSFASCWEVLRGAKAVVRGGKPISGMHELAYGAVFRNIGGLTPSASMSIREAAGTTSKSAVSYKYTIDTRDDRVMSTRGMYGKIYQELAGLGGDASFYKAEVESQLSRPLLPGVSGSVALRSGIVWALSRPTLFSDRFQLGGPLSVRSFQSNGLGPRDGPDSLGGDIYWSAGLSMISNIPKKAHWPVKTHVWLNAGRLDAMDRSRSVLENIRDTVTRPSVSAGVGLIYKFDPIRVEVNVGVPLVASRSDGTRRGVQVGIGLEFL